MSLPLAADAVLMPTYAINITAGCGFAAIDNAMKLAGRDIAGGVLVAFLHGVIVVLRMTHDPVDVAFEHEPGDLDVVVDVEPSVGCGLQDTNAVEQDLRAALLSRGDDLDFHALFDRAISDGGTAVDDAGDPTTQSVLRVRSRSSSVSPRSARWDITTSGGSTQTLPALSLLFTPA